MTDQLFLSQAVKLVSSKGFQKRQKTFHPRDHGPKQDMEQRLFQGSEQFSFFQQGWWELRDPCSQLQKGLRDTRRKLRPKCPGIKTSFRSGPPQCRCWSPPRAGPLLTPMDSVLQWRCKASAPWTLTWAVPADLELRRLFWALIPHESQQVKLIPAGLLAPSPLSRQDAEICPALPAGAAG